MQSGGVCWECKGTGDDPNAPENGYECVWCDGTGLRRAEFGRVKMTTPRPSDKFYFAPERRRNGSIIKNRAGIAGRRGA